jgi:hypothetical protein
VVGQQGAVRAGVDLRLGECERHRQEPIEGAAGLVGIVERADEKVLHAEVVITLGPASKNLAADCRVVAQPLLQLRDSRQRHRAAGPQQQVGGDADVVFVLEDGLAALGHGLRPAPLDITAHGGRLVADGEQRHHHVQSQDRMAGHGQGGHLLGVEMGFGEPGSRLVHQLPAGDRRTRAEDRRPRVVASPDRVEESLFAHETAGAMTRS